MKTPPSQWSVFTRRTTTTLSILIGVSSVLYGFHSFVIMPEVEDLGERTAAEFMDEHARFYHRPITERIEDIKDRLDRIERKLDALLRER